MTNYNACRIEGALGVMMRCLGPTALSCVLLPFDPCGLHFTKLSIEPRKSLFPSTFESHHRNAAPTVTHFKMHV